MFQLHIREAFHQPQFRILNQCPSKHLRRISFFVDYAEPGDEVVLCELRYYVQLGLAAALIEIVLGSLAGNLIDLRSNAWVDFVAGFGAIMLTFLAGAEIDPMVLRRQLKPAATIGLVSFLLPFLGALAYAYL